MTPEKVDQFFLGLSHRYPLPLKAVITGGSAAVLYGAPRATRDIDFELKEGKRFKPSPNQSSLEAAVESSRGEAQIAVEYTEDWDRTSSIARPRVSPRPIPYKTFGKTRVFLMHPLPWSIGKLCRFIESDIEDLAAIFRLKQRALKITPTKAVDYWGRALGESPRSSEQEQFRNHVREFLQNHGAAIWGSSLKPDPLFESFMAVARKASKTRN